MIELAGIHKHFDVVEVVRDVSFSVNEGEFVAMIGPSGCGKSTLLNMVSGLLKPDQGTVKYNGSEVRTVNTDVGYMTQNDTLLPWRVVFDNVAVPLEIKRVAKARRREAVQAAIADVGLAGFESHYPSQLSGGMRKRTQLARTLVYEPATLLMDEPFGAIDPLLKLVLQEDLLRLLEDHRRTVLYVTHDLDEAISLADRILVFTDRPARLALSVEVDLPRPRDLSDVRRTARFAELHQQIWETLRQEIAA